MQEAAGSSHSVKALLMGDESSKKSQIFSCIKEHYCQTQDKPDLFEDKAIFNFQLRPDCAVKIDLSNHRPDRTSSNFNFRGIQLVLVVFHYNDHTSFTNLKNWATEIRRYFRDIQSVVIIGNGFSNTRSEVTEDQAQAFAEAQGYNLFQVKEGDFESIQNALAKALNELPSLMLQSNAHINAISEKQVIGASSDPETDSCCRCVMF